MQRYKSGFESFIEHWSACVAEHDGATRRSFDELVALLLPDLSASQLKKAKSRMHDDEILGRLLSAHEHGFPEEEFLENPRDRNAERWKPRLRADISFEHVYAALTSVLGALAQRDADTVPNAFQLLVDEGDFVCVDLFYDRFRNPLVAELRGMLSGLYGNNLVRILDRADSLVEQATVILFVALCKDDAMAALCQDDKTVSYGHDAPAAGAFRSVIGARLVQYIPNVSGPDTEHVLDIDGDVPYTIMRKALGMPPGNSNWCVSRQHAEISRSAGGVWKIRDCSRWGTALIHNGEKRLLAYGDEHVLEDGDRLWLAPNPENPTEESAWRNGAVLRFEIRYRHA